MQESKRWAILRGVFDEKVAQRFWAKVNKDGPAPEAYPKLGPCWLWRPRAAAGGYGQFYVAGKVRLAHRVAYMLAFGSIPEGMVVDHRCEVRNCVRPDHLVATTQRDNVHRARAWEYGAAIQREKTHCASGHPYSGDNLRICKNGKRACRECERRYSREHRERNPKPLKPKVVRTHCKHGHEYTPDNLQPNNRGIQLCKQCNRTRARAYQASKRMKAGS